ncbi:hypothetical protein GOODEAATRI_010561, partial [Goodea atripinnis]
CYMTEGASRKAAWKKDLAVLQVLPFFPLEAGLPGAIPTPTPQPAPRYLIWAHVGRYWACTGTRSELWLHVAGALTGGQLGHVELLQQRLRCSQVREALGILDAMDWSTMGNESYQGLSSVTNHLLRLPLNADREGAAVGHRISFRFSCLLENYFVSQLKDFPLRICQSCGL